MEYRHLLWTVMPLSFNTHNYTHSHVIHHLSSLSQGTLEAIRYQKLTYLWTKLYIHLHSEKYQTYTQSDGTVSPHFAGLSRNWDNNLSHCPTCICSKCKNRRIKKKNRMLENDIAFNKRIGIRRSFMALCLSSSAMDVQIKAKFIALKNRHFHCLFLKTCLHNY